jgi:hypothetical protein
MGKRLRDRHDPIGEVSLIKIDLSIGANIAPINPKMIIRLVYEALLSLEDSSLIKIIQISDLVKNQSKNK